MIIAGAVTILFHRLRQPVVLGYILAGVIIGPYTPPFSLIQSEASIRTLADLGVVLLMFTLGMQFSLRMLRQVGATGLVAASLEIAVMVWLGYQLGRLFGWSKTDALFLGAMLSITSTTIVIKTLGELGLLKEKFARLITGISLVEDTLGITLTAILSGMAMTGTVELGPVGVTAGKAVVFLSTVLVLGLMLVPPLFRYIARFRSDETLLVTALGLCFGTALLAVKLGFSIALGAFLMGLIIGEAREAGKLRTLTEPLRDMFIAVFFVSVGLLIDLRVLWDYALPTLVLTVAVVLGKMASFTVGTFLAGNNVRTSLRVGTALIPIGELSLIIAALGLNLGVTSSFLYPIAVCVSALTTLITPYLVRRADGCVARLERLLPAEAANVLGIYSAWIERLARSRRDSPARRMIRKWLLQIGLNLALATGVFALAPLLAAKMTDGWPVRRWVPDWLGGAAGLVWLAAALLAMPALIAAVRKLGALAMLLAELSAGTGKATATIRAILQNTIYYAGITGVAVWVILLSTTLLPLGPGLWVLLLAVGTITAMSWRFFIQIHAKGQVALRESLAAATDAEPLASELERPEVVLLQHAQLERVILAPASAAAGKLIRETALRSQTGASIVGIQRSGASFINPSPDEELRPGDAVLLLGSTEQLAAARAILAEHRQ